MAIAPTAMKTMNSFTDAINGKGGETMAPTKDARIELTDDQLATLAQHIGDRMAQHPPVCRAFSSDEISWFKSCHQAALKTKNVAWATTVGFLVIGFLGVIGAGVIVKLREVMK